MAVLTVLNFMEKSIGLNLININDCYGNSSAIGWSGMILVDGHQLLAGVKWWLWSIGPILWLK